MRDKLSDNLGSEVWPALGTFILEHILELMIKYAVHATADDKVLCACNCNYCKSLLMATHPHAPPLQATPMHKHFTTHKHSEHSATHLQALLYNHYMYKQCHSTLDLNPSNYILLRMSTFIHAIHDYQQL